MSVTEVSASAEKVELRRDVTIWGSYMWATPMLALTSMPPWYVVARRKHGSARFALAGLSMYDR